MSESESVVLCEGYHDRAFWAGLLLHLGCKSLKPQRGNAVLDPFGVQVRGGQYAYRSKSDKFIRIVPCESKSNIRPIARTRLKERETKPLEQLVINVDADTNADGTPCASVTMSRQSMIDLVREFDENISEGHDGILRIDGGATEIALIRWEADDPVQGGLPNQQTLERLVCAALAAAYPQRGPCVQNWLDNRHEPPETTVKAYAWSYMAGWHAEMGCDAFYSCLWDDAMIQAELQSRLRNSGAWAVIDALTN